MATYSIMKSNAKLKPFFVTGTDTSVGKTIVSRALLQSFSRLGYRSAGYKPVALMSEGSTHGSRDVDVLLDASSIKLTEKQINPLLLQAGNVFDKDAESVDFKSVSAGLSHIADLTDVVIVEGTGGWRVLLSPEKGLAEWVIAEQLPVILTVGIQPGCLNQAILTAEAIKNDGLPLVGWIANRINPGLAYYAETIDILNQRLGAPLLGEIPYLGKAEQRDLSGYIDLSTFCKQSSAA